MTLGYVIIALLIASFIQMTVALYIEKIKPGEYGVPEPWYFPFSPKFWRGSSKSDANFNNIPQIISNPNYETEPIGKKAGIKIRGLKKIYGKKTAVNNLNLNIYEDEITVLLGHNGAGKVINLFHFIALINNSLSLVNDNGYANRSLSTDIRNSFY